jgi:uncharacterized protein
MKIGIMSDSHDNLDCVKSALELFKKEGCEKIIHAGDFISPFVFRLFKEYKIPVAGVFGNNDGEWIFLLKQAEGIGEIRKGPVELELAGRKIALMHEPVFLEALKKSRAYDLIIYGHTHGAVLDAVPPLVINPGECCGYLGGKATVAVCDLKDLSARLVTL